MNVSQLALIAAVVVTRVAVGAESSRAAGPEPGIVAKSREPAPLKRIAAANWRLASARPALPPVELVHHEALETQDFIEYAFGGGALRLFVSARRKGGDIFAMLVDTHEPRYADFAQLVPTARYGTYTGGTYVVVVPVRPLSHELFDKLKARRWTENELEQRLGSPSYRWHVHGIVRRTALRSVPGL